MGRKKAKARTLFYRRYLRFIRVGVVFALIVTVSTWTKLNTVTHKMVESGTVVKVTDGDTFTLGNGAIVRMMGITAPAYGAEAKRAREELKKLIEWKRVHLQYDLSRKDDFGRLLAWVWVNCDAPSVFSIGKNKPTPTPMVDKLIECKNGKLVQDEMMVKGVVRLTEI